MCHPKDALAGEEETKALRKEPEKGRVRKVGPARQSAEKEQRPGRRRREGVRDRNSQKHTQRGKHRDSEPEVFSKSSSSIQMVLMPQYHFSLI